MKKLIVILLLCCCKVYSQESKFSVNNRDTLCLDVTKTVFIDNGSDVIFMKCINKTDTSIYLLLTSEFEVGPGFYFEIIFDDETIFKRPILSSGIYYRSNGYQNNVITYKLRKDELFLFKTKRISYFKSNKCDFKEIEYKISSHLTKLLTLCYIFVVISM